MPLTSHWCSAATASAAERDDRRDPLKAPPCIVAIVLAAAEALEAEGISAEVIDLRSIRPLDHATLLQSVRKTHRMVVVDESWPFASVSSEIAYRIQKDAFDELDAPVVRVNGADVPMSYSMPLVAAYLPSVDKVVRAAKEVMYLRK